MCVVFATGILLKLVALVFLGQDGKFTTVEFTEIRCFVDCICMLQFSFHVALHWLAAPGLVV